MAFRITGTFARFFAAASLIACSGASAATLEKLSLDQMSQKATLIVRGRVTACSGEAQGSLIYTRCQLAVTETWKGSASGSVTFSIPGGQYQGMVQTFTGTPRITVDQEYVLFLWTGRSGRTQVIGLSQGVFDLVSGSRTTASGATAKVRRGASTELMLDSSGKPVTDSTVEMSVADLRSKVNRALGRSGGVTQ